MEINNNKGVYRGGPTVTDWPLLKADWSWECSLPCHSPILCMLLAIVKVGHSVLIVPLLMVLKSDVLGVFHCGGGAIPKIKITPLSLPSV